MIRKVLFTGFFVFIFAGAGFCYSDGDISALEMRKYGQTYNNDSLADRLMRLETDMFGMSQSGDLDSRINMLTQMAESYNTPSFSAPQYNYYNGEKKGFIRNLLDGFSSGAMTGFTPPFSTTGYSSYNYGNYGNYCPYENYSSGPYYKSHFRRPGSIISHHNHNNRHNWHRPHYRPHYNPNYSAYNPYGPYNARPTYGSTNVTTGSSVHILRD